MAATAMTLVVSSLLLSLRNTAGALVESERLAEYHARNYSWPPSNDEIKPPTAGWAKLFQRRFSQMDALLLEDNCYNGYMGSIHAGITCPNFTEYGYGLTLAPNALTAELKDLLHQGVQQGIGMRKESPTQSIHGEPDFVDLSTKLTDRALLMLQPIVEAWSGTTLVPFQAYGLRVYRNQSSLNMHIDRVESHVISAIMHVDHDANGEPWPLVIEDFRGNTVEVNLEAGDILLYESSKCYHGRPRPFNGEWYSSLFLHWHPVDWDPDMAMNTHYRVPPTWNTKVTSDYPALTVVETSLHEPECEHGWCALQESVVYSGPAPGYGKVMAGGKVQVLEGLIAQDELELKYFKETADVPAVSDADDDGL
jgi:hypothetical protein